MSDLSQLHLNADLASTGKKNGIPYTDAEKQMAKHVILGLLLAAGHLEGDHPEAEKISEETIVAISETIEENDGNKLGIPNLARRAFSKVVSSHFDEDGNSDNVDNWPKKRDYTSIGLIFRKGLKTLEGVSKEDIDIMFPTYKPSKKKAN